MAIILNGVTLSGSMQWTDRYAYSPVAQTVIRTLGGGSIVYSQGLSKGQPITLESQSDTGWITYAMLQALLAMAATPGAVYNLEVHGEFNDVVFRHDAAPAVDFTPLQPKAEPDSGDYFTGTLKLLTI